MAPSILVLSGGESEEKEVSLKTGRAIFQALSSRYNVQLMELDKNELPEDVLNFEGVIFPALHGSWGEDGSLQKILEKNKIEFAGSNSASSSLCFDKTLTKKVVAEEGIPVAMGFEIDTDTAANQLESLDEKLSYIVKPVCQGSSVGLQTVKGSNLKHTLSGLQGRWLVEQRIEGMDVTVGVIEGEAQGVIGVRPKGGIYDYKHKYTTGLTTYEVPANISDQLSSQIRTYAVNAYKALDCRDFARIDFMLSFDEKIYFLEANTLPGMTDTSLLPKSASIYGLTFNELVKRLVTPAINRFNLTDSNNENTQK